MPGSQRSKAITPNQRLALFIALALIFGASNLLLSPMGEGVGSFWNDLWIMGRNGVLFGQPAALAIWAVFGNQRLAIRLPGALLLSASLGLTMLWGEARNHDWAVDSNRPWQQALQGIIVCISVQLPLWLLRIFRGWRLEDPFGSRNADDDRRIGLLLMLGWITLLSIILGLWRALPIEREGLFSLAAPTSFAHVLRVSAETAALNLPMVPLLGICLAKRRRRFVIVWLTLIGLATTTDAVAALARGSNVQESAFRLLQVELGILAATAIPMLIMRACGLRLVRGGKDSDGLADSIQAAIVTPSRWSSRRMVGLTTLLCVLAGLVACATVLREPLRRTMVQHAKLARLGFASGFDGGQLTVLVLQDGGPITADQMRVVLSSKSLQSLDLKAPTKEQLAALRQLPSLTSLNLSGKSVDDAALLEIGRLENLVDLGLPWTAITDAGLAHLQSLKKLRTLSLASTAITDAGLDELASCSNLQSVWLAGTPVTGAGVARLQAALPKALITPSANMLSNSVTASSK